MNSRIENIEDFLREAAIEVPHMRDELLRQKWSYLTIPKVIRKVARELRKHGSEDEAFRREVFTQIDNLTHGRCIAWGKTLAPRVRVRIESNDR